jgi:hypothetical protein
VLEVAPGMAVPFWNHWYVNGPLPEAVTLNVAVWPATTVTLTGWLIVMDEFAAIFDPWNPPLHALSPRTLRSAAKTQHPTLDARRGTRRIKKKLLATSVNDPS